MKFGNFFLLSLIVYISIIQISASNQYLDESDDEYEQFKRFISGNKKTTNSPSGVCTSNSCENGGICIAKGQETYECKCVGPWRGTHCSIPNACYNSPCQNGGTCLNVLNDYWCKCTSDYYGNNCQTNFSKRTASARKSLYNLIKDRKRINTGKTGSNEDDTDGRAYYDYKNGIYF